MRLKTVFCIGCVFLQIQWVSSFLDPITWGLGIAGVSGLYYMFKSDPPKKTPYCDHSECCDSHWIPKRITNLDDQLARVLHGQRIAHDTVVRALRGYVGTRNHPKALAMSFHGLPGSGKNFVAGIIVDNFFRKQSGSEYYHFFNGRVIAPDKTKLEEYQEHLKWTIVKSLQKCEQSIFVFDEVDMMPDGLLNVLVPFLDYSPSTSVDVRGNRYRVKTNEAIFIFLSNTGSNAIMDQMMRSWSAGVDRKTMTLKDFENLIAIGAFNEKGGFQKSDTIRTNLIDHYVPFLPLEEEHVRLCMRDAFARRIHGKPSPEMEEDVLSVVTYGPEPHNIYSKSGCKKIEQKVSSAVYRTQNNEI